MKPTIRLRDLLACPDCRGRLERVGDRLRCRACGAGHAIEHGIPRLLPAHARDLQIEHEMELSVRTRFLPCLEAMIGALGADQVVLDIGAGERETDDPRVLRLDLRFTPRVDVVADAHVLPLQDASVDVALAGAVFEHLADPVQAAREIHRVLKPGGMVIADCAFVFPFHGFPASYFHASADGLRQVFRDFTAVGVEVPPWFRPSIGLRAVLVEWITRCKPRTAHDREFLAAIRGLERFDLEQLDACFAPADAMRVAAGTAFLGLKQPAGRDAATGQSVLPPPAMALWRSDPELQRRFPRPAALLTTLHDDAAEHSYLCWCADAGRRRSPELDAWYAARPTVDKDLRFPPASCAGTPPGRPGR